LTTAPVPTPTAADLAADVVRILAVEEQEPGVFLGPPPRGGTGRPFGGRLIGQALAAAARTVEAGRPAHSLHAYFLRPGDEALPIAYRVVKERDGRGFSIRRVTAVQNGRDLLSMAASFYVPESGLEHQVEAPQVPPPEALVSEADYWRPRADELPPGVYAQLARPRSMELRPISHRPFLPQEPRPPDQQVWFRAAAPLEDDPVLHRTMLAYASDMLLLGTSKLPHGVNWLTHPMTMASLDHALWIHHDVRMDGWLLFCMDSPWSGHGRGLARGLIFDRSGRLIANVAQEGLIRLRTPA